MWELSVAVPATLEISKIFVGVFVSGSFISLVLTVCVLKALVENVSVLRTGTVTVDVEGS